MSAAFTPFAGERYAVMGLGRSGLPVARALLSYGADVVAWDDAEQSRRTAANAGLPVADLGAIDLRGFDGLVLSPGIPHRLPAPHPIAARALAAGVPILAEADLLWRAVRLRGSRARFVGITGTNGKSTTTALTGSILARAGIPVAVGGNFGTPALALTMLGDDGVFVLEMSSYALERLASIRFDAAAMLNLSPDHLDRHGDMAGYAAAKRAIFNRQDAACTAVIGVDDAWSRAMAEDLGRGLARVVRISGEGAVPGGVYVEHGRLIDDRDALRTRLASLVGHRSLLGRHNAQNAAAAAALALALGVAREDIAAAIATFPGLPHRQERVAEIDGVLFINDSKATNADSAARAMACYDRFHWIVGGRAKAGGIQPLAPLFPRVARAWLIGEAAEEFARTLGEAGVPHELCGTLENAVHAAFAAARREAPAVVLLSPACASFDQFPGFEARGETFRQLVASLRVRASA